MRQSCFLKTHIRTLLLMIPVSFNLLSPLDIMWIGIIYNFLINSTLVKKVTTSLDLSLASVLECIPKLLLINCEPELSNILAEPFNKCLSESCFPEHWKVITVVPVLNNGGEMSAAKNYQPFNLLFLVSKVFEKLVKNKLVVNLWGFFFLFPGLP